jgi:hypothetical protein
MIEDIRTVFPEDPDILSAKSTMSLARSMNPRLIIEFWNGYIMKKYLSEIEAGDLEFFISKDYTEDLKNMPNAAKITQSIDRLRKPIKNMNEDDKKKVLVYIQNLTKLATMYYG